MLREVKNRRLKPRIVPFQITTSASGVTVDIGAGDITATRGSAGVGYVYPVNPFARNGLMILQQSGSTGYYSALNMTAGTGSAFRYARIDNSGNGAEGTLDGILFGWDNAADELVGIHNIKATNERPRMIWGKIESGATVSIGASDFSVSSSATGTYEVLFTKAFGKTPIVIAQPVNATVLASSTSSKTAYGVTVKLAERTPTLTDGDFYIFVIGSDSTSDSYDGGMPLQTSQRRVQIFGAEVTNDTGAWTKSIGSDDFGDITDVGVGDFSMSVESETMGRDGIVLATTTTHQAQVAEDFSSGLVHVKTLNFLGNADDDDGVTHILAIGSLDATEY